MDDDLRSFLAAACLLGGGGNVNNPVPIDDVTDIDKGARYIPGEVTLARRRGERVMFNPEQHTWSLPDGREIT